MRFVLCAADRAIEEIEYLRFSIRFNSNGSSQRIQCADRGLGDMNGAMIILKHRANLFFTHSLEKHHRQTAVLANVRRTVAIHKFRGLHVQVSGKAKQVERGNQDVFAMLAAFATLITAELERIINGQGMLKKVFGQMVHNLPPSNISNSKMVIYRATEVILRIGFRIPQKAVQCNQPGLVVIDIKAVLVVIGSFKRKQSGVQTAVRIAF